MKCLGLMLMAGLIVATAARAEPPRRPDEPPGPSRERGDGPPQSRQRDDGPSWRGRENPEINWKEVEEFFKQYSPRRYEAYLKLDERQREGIRGRMAWQHGMVKWMESRGETDLVTITREQMAQEDALFGLKIEFLEQGGASMPEEKKLQLVARARDHVRKLVELRLRERATRLEGMRKLLQKEEENLATDRQNTEGMVEAMLKDFPDIPTGGRPQRPPSGRRPGDQHGGKDPGKEGKP